jgi:hypothetical protein
MYFPQLGETFTLALGQRMNTLRAFRCVESDFNMKFVKVTALHARAGVFTLSHWNWERVKVRRADD